MKLNSHHNFSRRLVLNKIQSFLPKRGICLDIGCGRGYYTDMLRQVGVTCHGLDVMFEDDRFNVPVMRGDAENLPIKSGSHDFVLMNQILEHIEHDKKAVREANRVLKIGGRLLITVPSVSLAAKVDTKGDPHDHYREGYSINDMTKILKDRGFQVKETGYYEKSISHLLRVIWWKIIDYRASKRGEKKGKIPTEIELSKTKYVLFNIILHIMLLLSKLDILDPTTGYGIYVLATKN